MSTFRNKKVIFHWVTARQELHRHSRELWQNHPSPRASHCYSDSRIVSTSICLSNKWLSVAKSTQYVRRVFSVSTVDCAAQQLRRRSIDWAPLYIETWSSRNFERAQSGECLVHQKVRHVRTQPLGPPPQHRRVNTCLRLEDNGTPRKCGNLKERRKVLSSSSPT